MSVRQVLEWPDPRLSQRCQPVAESDTSTKALVDDLFETMYASMGRGLAAPQVGVMLRVFVMDVGWKEGRNMPLACVNPTIIEASSKVDVGPEQCLSMPGVTARVERHASLVLGFVGTSGALEQRRLVGAEAICAQHELDHLDGIMHMDRMGNVDRLALLAEYGQFS